MRVGTHPIRYPDAFQSFRQNGPYPMQFMQAPSFNHQLLIDYGGQTALQGLSTVRGPFMFPVRREIIYPVGRSNRPAYPITHSIPSPFQQKYIGLMGELMGPQMGESMGPQMGWDEGQQFAPVIGAQMQPQYAPVMQPQYAPVMQPQMPSATFGFYTRK